MGQPWDIEALHSQGGLSIVTEILASLSNSSSSVGHFSGKRPETRKPQNSLMDVLVKKYVYKETDRRN